jgi:hypothetical protein
MIYRPSHQPAAINAVPLQIIHRVLHCRVVGVWASKRHINKHCKQIIDSC